MGAGGEKLLRRLLGFAGLLALFSALFGDQIGLSSGDGFSRNQIMIAVLGAVLVAASILWNKCIHIYRNVSLVAMNFLMALVALELVSLVVIKVWNPGAIAMRIKKEREGDLVHVEVTTVPGHYVSYLVWQADSLLQGEETTDDRGLRRTPGNSDDPDAFNIFVFGGSAMWGSGVPDSCTIASRLRENLAASTDLRVSVTNYGQISWVSSQELLSLLLELRDGRIPDLVIFYDGFNDVWSSYQVGRAGEHQNYPQIRDRVEGIDILRVQNSLFAQLVGRTNTAQLIQLMRTAGTLAEEPREIITYATMGTDPVALAESTFAVYRRNMEMASLLGDGFGFDCLFIWQPCIWCGSKPMTENEHDIWVGGSPAFQAGGDPAWKELVVLTQSLAASNADSSEDYFDFSTVFDSSATEFYSDFSGCHLNQDGNEYISSEIVRIILDDLAHESAEQVDSALRVD